MKNKVIIHAHFYQPPREDPWSGVVPFQESAQPYHDWNQRITKECYAANGMSRILNPFGQITDIVNNYRHISFNFGPTLLNWLKANAPYVYENIIIADRLSLAQNNNHGNAIAQAYNHTILPLATDDDAKTQIKWGLADFEANFNRKAEGMWLPEAAINPQVIDTLIREKVAFIILSPWQAEAICPIGSNKWQPLTNTPVPTGRAYRIDRPDGSINVFFYNHILAHGISFEHYLRNADKLYEHFLSFRQNADPTHLVNVATDGEVYGHHEPFGDMCLSAFCKILEAKDEFVLTNYGAYLEQNPPTYLVKLKEGENSLGTSWSCFHGVSRWFRNCGCTTGGEAHWNQEWRTPLRNAFNFLNNKLKDVFVKQMSALSTANPMDIRNDYISVLTGKTERDAFAAQKIDKADSSQAAVRSVFFTLLEQQKFCQFMFTSCGWFFSEISGIEATQNLKYAIKAYDLFSGPGGHDILSAFLSEIETARSNITAFGSGRNIVESWVIPSKKDLSYGASIFVLSDIFADDMLITDSYGIFRKDRYSLDSKPTKENLSEKSGAITVSDYTIYKSDSFSFSLKEEPLKGVYLTLAPDGNNRGVGKTIEVSLGTLPIEMRLYITKIVSRQVVDKCITGFKEALNETENALVYLKNLNTTLPKTIVELAELLINSMFEKLLNDPKIIPNEDELETLRFLKKFSQEHNLTVDIDSLKNKFSCMISFQIDRLTEDVEEETVKTIVLFTETARSLKAEPEITRAQEKVYQYLNAHRNYSILDIEKEKDFETFNKLRRLIKLGSVFGIYVDDFKEKFFSV
jgi:hypothetical protein